MKKHLLLLALPFALLSLAGCRQKAVTETVAVSPPQELNEMPAPKSALYLRVTDTVRVRQYFKFMDRVVAQYDSLVPYSLTEHLLVRFNPWLIDTLQNTDYYRRKARGEWVYDQRQLPVLLPGDTLFVPDLVAADRLSRDMAATWLDINIPEFRLRIVRDRDTLYSIPVRVGKNKRQFQSVLNRVVDLRTRTGIGTIIRANRDPDWFIDPHSGKKFTTTRRDDGRVTKMPVIPWLEPEINGVRLGQMIHPTTNPRSLGKAASNGCIGCAEAEAWRIYYYAPVGTRVVIRYDTEIATNAGDTLHLPDIYGWNKK